MIFTMDVEDWYHAENVRKFANPAEHSSLSVIHDVLALLNELGAKGTFFCLGTIAEQSPTLLREIVEQGHEVGSHGYDHKLIGAMSKAELLEDLKKSKYAIEQATLVECVGYRSPCFSYNNHLDTLLIQLGYRYKSCGISASIHDRYGSEQASSELIPDFPLPSAELGGFQLPATGGGYFRLFPFWLQSTLLRFAPQDPLVFYCHPWDFDTQQPKLDRAPLLAKFRHTVGNAAAQHKLRKFRFSSEPLRNLI